jgi:hypothetical protein
VFAFLADLRSHWRLLRRLAELDALADDAAGRRVRIRGPLGLSRVARTRVLVAEAPRRLAGRAEVGRGTVGAVRWEIVPAGDGGSRVTLAARVESASPFDRARARDRPRRVCRDEGGRGAGRRRRRTRLGAGRRGGAGAPRAVALVGRRPRARASIPAPRRLGSGGRPRDRRARPRVIGRRSAAIRRLSLVPQLADHALFGAIVGTLSPGRPGS